MAITKDWKYNSWFHIVLLAAAILVAYFHVLHAGFISWDDPEYVTANADIHGFSREHIRNWFTHFYIGNYHPLVLAGYAIDWMLGGQSPAVYHGTNIVLHILNALILYTLTFRLFDKKSVALFVALMFALHPVQTESVSWIAERKNVLYSFFFLLSLSSYISYVTEEDNKRLVAVVLAGIAAMLSKASAITLPVTFFAIDIWLQRPLKDRKVWMEKLPLLIPAIIIGLIGIQAQKQGAFLNLHPDISFIKSLVYAGYAYTSYIVRLFAPVRLSVLYPYPQQIGAIHILYSVAAAAMLWLGWHAYRKKWFVLCGSIVFYTVNIALVLQFVQFGEVLMADRYLYIPCIGIWIAVFYYLLEWAQRKGRKAAAIAVSSIAAAGLLLLTVMRNDIWMSEMNFWEAIVKTFPNSSVAQNSMGGVYLKMGDYPSALRHIETAITYDANNYKAWYNKGVVHLRRAENEAALQALDRAIAIQEYPQALFSRALLLQQTGQTQRAMNDIEKVLMQEPDNPRAYFIKASCMEQQNNLQAAADNYTQSILYDNEEPIFYLRRGIVHLNLQKHVAALNDFSSAIALRNNYAEAWYWRGIVKYNMRKEPCADLNQARQLGYAPAIDALMKICNAD